MKQKFFFYLVIFFVNTSQCMNITSSLHNLEKKLSQLKPFLAKKEEPQEDVSTLFKQLETNINSMKQYTNNLETNINSMKQYTNNVDINLEDLFNKIDLKNIQVDSSGNPKNTIAQDSAQKAKLIWENYNNTVNNIQKSWEILSKISDYFKKDLLTENQKTKLISILTEFSKNANSLENIAIALNDIDLRLRIFLNLTFEIPTDIIPTNDFIDYLRHDLDVLQKRIVVNSSRIKKLVENNATFIKKDIEEFKDFEQQIQTMYKQILNFFEQMQKFGMPEKEMELNKIFENFKKISLKPLVNLIYLISIIKDYAPFLKDPKLKKELLTILQSPNLKFADKYKQEMDKLSGVLLPNDIKSLILYISKLFVALERIAQETESILK